MTSKITTSLILGVILFCGCKLDKKEQETTNQIFTNETISTYPSDIDTTIETDSFEIDTLYLPQVDTLQGIEILLPAMYRLEEPEDFMYLLSETWYGIYLDTTSLCNVLDKVEFDISKQPDDCLGLGVLTTCVSNKNNRKFTLFIKGIEVKNPILNTLKLDQITIPTNTSYTFVWNNVEYQLRATGICENENSIYCTEDELGRKYYNEYNPSNYKLYLSTSNQEQLLIAIPHLNGTNVSISFIGDLDEDGLPDFIFETSAEYESYQTVLFLSSKAKENEFVRCVAESSYAFDC